MNQMPPGVRLQMIAMGIPPWLDHFQKLNSIQNWGALILSVILAFSESILAGVFFFIAYHVLRICIVGVGMSFTQKSNSPTAFTVAVIAATFLMLCLNIAAATYVMDVWELPRNFV